MKPYIDKSTNEQGKTEYSIHGLSDEEKNILITGLKTIISVKALKYSKSHKPIEDITDEFKNNNNTLLNLTDNLIEQKKL